MHERAKNIILLPLRHADELRVILAVQRDLGALLDVEPVVVAVPGLGLPGREVGSRWR